MKKRINIIGGIAMAALICLGCAHPFGTPVDDNWGNSYHMNRTSQLVHPEGREPSVPAEGHDGMAAAAAMNKYRDSFKKATPPPIYNISFGL